MSASTTLIVVFVALVAALLGLWALWAYRRPAKPAKPKHAGNETSKAKNQVEQWGVRISAPAKERACPQVQELLGKEFPIGKKPALPLPDCPYPHECQCHYIKLFDRRRHERRKEEERREAQRFEDASSSRRSGKDRRKSKIDWSD
ncbi:MAG: hypothetical protein M3R31_00630 [Pseudomonadota bacterium]|nr:hypothetical protein [Pseudomonadota bacterium]